MKVKEKTFEGGYEALIKWYRDLAGYPDAQDEDDGDDDDDDDDDDSSSSSSGGPPPADYPSDFSDLEEEFLSRTE